MPSARMQPFFTPEVIDYYCPLLPPNRSCAYAAIGPANRIPDKYNSSKEYHANPSCKVVKTFVHTLRKYAMMETRYMGNAHQSQWEVHGIAKESKSI